MSVGERAKERNGRKDKEDEREGAPGHLAAV